MDINKYDEKTKSLIELCLEQQRTRDPKALSSLEALKKVAEKAKDNELLGFACFYIANTHYRMNLNNHHFRSYLVKGISCLQQTDDYALLARSYNYVGIDACNNGCFDVAYHYFMMAQRILDPLDEPYMKSIVAVNLGQLYARLGNFHLARQTIRLAIQLAGTPADDFYYDYNFVGCCCMDGFLSIQLKDYKSAKASDETIRLVEERVPEGTLMGMHVMMFILRAELALVDNDRDRFEEYQKQILDFIMHSDTVFDFIEDIVQYSLFLIEQNELPHVRSILDSIDESAMRTGSVQMMFNVTEVEIAYYDTVKDEEQLHFFLRRQFDLEKRRQSEQNRIYFLSINLIDSMYEDLKRLSPDGQRPAVIEIPNTKEYQDELTGLPNRMALSICLENAFRSARSNHHALGVAVLHVGNLPDYHAAHGKKAGTILMQRLGLELRVIAYQYQIHCMRYDGLAFVMVFENMDHSGVLKITDALTSKTDFLDGGEADGSKLTVCIGICNHVPDENDTLTGYLMESHVALAEAKEMRGDEPHAVVIRP